MQDDVRKLVQTFRVPRMAQQNGVHHSDGRNVEGGSRGYNGVEKNLPQREFAARREKVSTNATRRFVRRVKKLK